MKNLFTAILFAIALTGVSLAQAQAKGSTNGKVRLAVVEFTPGTTASTMTAEAKRQLQASIAFSLTETKKFDIVDVRNTRAASQADLAAINGGSTAAAVRIGKQLGVAYVLTGNVAEYNFRGNATLKPRLVEVATGKVKYIGEIEQGSTSAMTMNAGHPEMMLKVLKPAIQKLTAAAVMAI